MKNHVLSSLSILILTAVSSTSPVEAGWALDGAPVCINGGVQEQVQVCQDDSGGVIIVWRDRRSEPDIYAQRLDETGRRKWAENGIIVCGIDGDQELPVMISDGAGGAFVAWQDYRNGTDYDIYMQRFDPSGTMLWSEGGVPVCVATGNQGMTTIHADESGGCIIAWQDTRASAQSDIYIQRMTGDGEPVWTVDGMEVCGEAGIQAQPRIVSDGYGGAFVVWQDLRGDSRTYAQRILPAGTAGWVEGGVQLFTGTYPQYGQRIASDRARGFYASMYDGNHRAYVQRVAQDGTVRFAPSGVLLGQNSPYYTSPLMIEDGIGGAILAWQSWRDSDHYEVWGQRIDRTGTLLWGVNAIPIGAYGGSCYELCMTGDGERGAIVTWRDTRSITSSSNDIYIQRVDSMGVAQWTLDGQALCTADGSQSGPAITGDGAGGAIVAWEDDRVSNDIYAMKITSSGAFVATALQSFSIRPEEGAVTIEWSMSSLDEDVKFIISRKDCAASAARSPVFEWIGSVSSSPGILEYSFADDSAGPGGEYVYRVSVTGEERDPSVLFETGPTGLPPIEAYLAQNFPNPFNPATTIAFGLPRAMRVKLTVYDTSGRLVKVLVDEEKGAGHHKSYWDGSNTSGVPAASGVYYFRLTAESLNRTGKMVLLR